MSVNKFKLKLARSALSDFSNLLSFTLQTWGREQFLLYQNKMDIALNEITKNPYLGRKKYGLMVYSVGQHNVFYRVEENTIFVLRILHNRMDSLQHLQ